VAPLLAIALGAWLSWRDHGSAAALLTTGLPAVALLRGWACSPRSAALGWAALAMALVTIPVATVTAYGPQDAPILCCCPL
jgi:hypothetical protein